MQLRVKKEVFGWRSPRLGIDRPIVRYGHWGTPLILFPTAGRWMIDAPLKQ